MWHALGGWLVGIISKDLANWLVVTITVWLAKRAVEASAENDEKQLEDAKTAAEKQAAAEQIDQDVFH